MKTILLMIAAAASVAAAAPAFARDGDQGRRAERHERGGQDRGGRGVEHRRHYDGGRSRHDDRRYEDRRRYDDGPRPDYMQGPRPNYMRPPPGGGRRGPHLPDGYRGDVVGDYQRYRLRPPPHGYAWVRVGNGFALVEMGSGRIFDRVN